MVELLVKLACFVKKGKNIFSIKSCWSESAVSSLLAYSVCYEFLLKEFLLIFDLLYCMSLRQLRLLILQPSGFLLCGVDLTLVP